MPAADPQIRPACSDARLPPAEPLGDSATAVRARKRGREKRGGSWNRVTLDERSEPGSPSADVDILALHVALESLAELHERQARVVELRFFGGLSVPETAELLEVSERTVVSDWTLARTWLFRELREKGAVSPSRPSEEE